MSDDDYLSFSYSMGETTKCVETNLLKLLHLIREEPTIAANARVILFQSLGHRDGREIPLKSSHFGRDIDLQISAALNQRLAEERAEERYEGAGYGDRHRYQSWQTLLYEQLQHLAPAHYIALTDFDNTNESYDEIYCIAVIVPREVSGRQSATFDIDDTENLTLASLRGLTRKATNLMKAADAIFHLYQGDADTYVPPLGIAREAAASIISRTIEHSDARERFFENRLSFIEFIAGMSYESQEAQGVIAFISTEAAIKNSAIKFRHPIFFGFENCRMIRKLLEVTKDRAIICDSENIFGICAAVSKLERVADVFSITFTGGHRFQLQQGQRTIFQMIGGVPQCAIRRINLIDIEECFTLKFGNTHQIRQLSKHVHQLTGILKGAALVFSEDAIAEAKRLSHSAVVIEPITITDYKSVKSLSQVDGAILADKRGLIHAFGVILDGNSIELHENPSRGSRFNSAVRYVHTAQRMQSTSIAVIFSEDGGADLIYTGTKSPS